MNDDGMLVWKDPPPSEYRAARAEAIKAIADELRAHPGQWALISTHKTRQAANVAAKNRRLGQLVAYRPAGSFEAVQRGLEVYARYVGEPEVAS